MTDNLDTTVQVFLKNEFEKRKNKHKHYSLRTFAKDMSLSASVLSRILNQKSKISLKNLKIINSKLKLPDGAVEAAESHKSAKNHWRVKDLTFLTSAEVQLVQSWYFAVIWEGVSLNQFKLDSKVLAKKLDISEKNVSQCIELMIQKKLVFKDNDGNWKTDYLKASTLQIKNTTDELKKLQINFFLNSIEAIQKIDVSRRDHSTIFIAGDDKVVDEVKKKIAQFRRSIDRLIVKNTNLNSKQVFQLSIGFSPTLKP